MVSGLPEDNEIDLYLEKSIQRLSVAKQLLESGFYNDRGGRAYYEMFFAAKAMLLRKNINQRHTGVSSLRLDQNMFKKI